MLFRLGATLQITPEEHHWLENEWTRTRRTLERLLIPLVVEMLDRYEGESELMDGAWTWFLTQATTTLDRKSAISRAGRLSALYDTAISMLAGAELLRAQIGSSYDQLRTDEGAKLVRSCVRRGITNMRHRLISDSAHRSQTWTRLDRTSRQLHQRRVRAGLERPEDGRCNNQHIQALHELILNSAAVANDEGGAANWGAGQDALTVRHLKLLPRKTDTIHGYFEEFCPDCLRQQDLDALSPEDIGELPEHDRKIDYLEDCIERLDEPLKAAIHGLYRIGNTVDIDISAACKRLGIDRFKLHRRAEKARGELKLCLEGKIEMELP